MNQTYIIIDVLNLFFRVRHTAHVHATLDDKIGMSMHVMIASANKAVKLVNADHVVFALDGHSWRKAIYEPYKKTRAVARLKRTEKEIEEDELFFETLNDFIDYFKTKTNCTVIKQENAEADDVIYRWIKLHPNDKHVILSSDTDFVQLISESVSQYNGITKEWITYNGTFNDDNKVIIDKKTNLPKQIKDPKWLLFEKCIRGDKSDNIFSAYPGVRTKGTKNKVGLLEAFADMDNKGFNYNNLMLQRWVDHNEKEHKVLDDYTRNRTLIDLSQIPKDIVDAIDLEIVTTLINNEENASSKNQILFHFMKFCNRHNLVRLAEYPQDVVSWITKEYTGDLHVE